MGSMTRRLLQSAALAVVVSSPLLAQGPQPPHKNTQILDKNMPGPQLIQIMQGFNAALGVTCNHCHTFVGPQNPMNDFVSDAKPTKKTARTMMLMTRDLNARLDAELGKPQAEITAAQRAASDNRPDDALAYLALNLEFFPMSARSHQALSQAYERRKDQENALKSLRRAIELDPNNAQYKQELARLEK
jgi:tetratricopeptide (TPR) repeat protein